MNQPEQIVRTLDLNLVDSTRLILYGRSALALGFPNPQPPFFATMDVDAILPDVQMNSIEANDQFWTAIEKTNDQLRLSGLYLTHLFTDSQIILRSNWLDYILPVPLNGLRHLSLFRPDTCDLILTKMMRIDPQDRSDIAFLLQHLSLNEEQMESLLDSARVPPIPEIQDAYDQNSVWLRRFLAENSASP